MSDVLWNGEGLPPAGAVCDIKLAHHDWRKLTVQYASDDLLVANDGERDLCWKTEHCIFRPTRTSDQIRDEAAKQLCLDAGSPAMTPAQMETAYRLYDAGYRKQVAT